MVIPSVRAAYQVGHGFIQMPDPGYLRAQIERLRRLLQGISDEQTRDALKKMLADYTAEMRRLCDRKPDHGPDR
jgi:hypothetical protein